jgi:hypothetical protein
MDGARSSSPGRAQPHVPAGLPGGPTPGDQGAARWLAEVLAERGDLEGAAQILRARAAAGDGFAARRLAELLAERGDLDGLRARAAAGDRYVAEPLARLLIKQDRGAEAERRPDFV